VPTDLTGLADLLLSAGVLTFGDFTTKSGRATPYFLNFGNVHTGSQVAALGELYAEVIDETFGRDVDVLFGPAYKGIPLAVATATALERRQGRAVGFCFDRKEAKDHGEGGLLVGQVPRDGDRVVIVEDVTTAGTSVRETIPKLRAAAPQVQVVGLVVAVDRQERAPDDDRPALQAVGEDNALVATAIARIDELVDHLATRDHGTLADADVARFRDYRLRWGA